MHKSLDAVVLLLPLLAASTQAAAQHTPPYLPEPAGVEAIAFREARALRETHAGVRRNSANAIPAPEKARAKQIELTTRFVELDLNARDFFQWNSVSGDHPAVVEHDTRSTAYGLTGIAGFQVAMPRTWAVVGVHYDSGLETTTRLAGGEKIHSEVDSYGIGAGVEYAPIDWGQFAVKMWAMEYLDWDDGDFYYDDNGILHEERRFHHSGMTDIGAALLYMVQETLGVRLGIGYNGMLKASNADENVRLSIGIYIPHLRRAVE